MDDADPLTHFFPDSQDDILYSVLGLQPDASPADITKAYRKAALLHHPDKHAAASAEKRAAEATIFQQVGFAYAVLKDETRRKRYDATGRTNEGSFLEDGEAKGWEAYFEEVFDEVSKSKLDEMQAEYQGSEEEKADLLAAYKEHAGSLPDIMDNVVFSRAADEARFVALINDALASGALERLPAWDKTSTDKKAARARAKKEGKEAAEAEEHAKEIGVWDEFYGSGKKAPKKSRADKGKKAADSAGDDDGDLEGLKALILKRNQNRANDLIDSIAAKHVKGGSGKKAGKAQKDEPAPEDLDDETFERLQKEMADRMSSSKKRTAAKAGGGASKKRKGKQ